jgi:hypothetical protein
VDRGFFPLDRQLGLNERHWSEGVSQLAVWLSGQVDFEAVEAILAKVGRIYLSDSTAWRHTQHWGTGFQQAEAQAQAQAGQVELNGGIVPGEAGNADRLGVAMDGWMIHIRQEDWKEVKSGCIFRVIPGAKTDQPTQEPIEVGKATDLSYTAYLGGPEAFGQKIWAEANRRHWTRAADTQAIGDGAVWIWNLVTEHFYDSVQVVDWYHAKSHLAAAAQGLYGQSGPQMQGWLNAQETLLFEGHADKLAQTLEQGLARSAVDREAVRGEAHYFETNKRRMEYLDRRMEGWIIGSGMIESGAKQYQDRFTGAGMQWSRAGAERLLPIRSAILSNTFDATWHRVYYAPLN